MCALPVPPHPCHPQYHPQYHPASFPLALASAPRSSSLNVLGATDHPSATTTGAPLVSLARAWYGRPRSCLVRSPLLPRRGMSVDLADKGIAVVAVAPGMVTTGFVPGAGGPAMMTKMGGHAGRNLVRGPAQSVRRPLHGNDRAVHERQEGRPSRRICWRLVKPSKNARRGRGHGGIVAVTAAGSRHSGPSSHSTVTAQSQHSHRPTDSPWPAAQLEFHNPNCPTPPCPLQVTLGIILRTRAAAALPVRARIHTNRT